MRKLTALVGSCLFFLVMVLLYLMLDSAGFGVDHDKFFRETSEASVSFKRLQDEYDRLEGGFKNSGKAIASLHEKFDDAHWFYSNKNSDVDHIVKMDMQKLAPANSKIEEEHGHHEKIKFSPRKNFETLPAASRNQEMCLFSDAPSGHRQDIRMLDKFDEWVFDNPDGGVWKQGWDITYAHNSFDAQELLVFVMPHSHNDPGWLKTFDAYYRDQTSQIITNVINALAKDAKRKFIWAETSYLARWWSEASPSQKDLAQSQINSGQLEIVTGGWVMNDEANPHYFSMLEQMTEGHQWLEKHVGVKPKHGWAIDPFGYSPTMAYLLKRMGFDAMLIQRVHYHIKKQLAQDKNLQFMWRQNWDHVDDTDMFCHLMPFYSYDIPHTCGPDPKICCQFDFRRLPGGGHLCPWHVPPVEIDSVNVKARSELLLDQYKKQAQLYRSNVVLAPLGDDFRYETTFETQKQYDNYERIMEYINARPEYKAKVQFGTLKDFFEAIWRREDVENGKKPPYFPTLGGDFFTYADRDNHYWSGYYTSRSFFKHMDRELAAHLRGAEILFSLANAHSRHLKGAFPETDLYPKLLRARQQLSLFQHHDGITGTAKDHVVVDYAERMLKSISDSVAVMQASSAFLLAKSKADYIADRSGLPLLQFSESRSRSDSVPVKDTLIISTDPRFVVFYNSLAQERHQTVSLIISEMFVQVLDSNGETVPHQVSHVWKSGSEVDSTKYELSFVAVIPALGLARYVIKRDVENVDHLASHQVVNVADVKNKNSKFEVRFGKDTQFIIRNEHMQAVFDGDTGLLTDLVCGGFSQKMQIVFLSYGTVGNMDRSGAYLFLPAGEAKSIGATGAPVVVTRGKIFSEVRAYLKYVVHSVRVYHGDVPEAKSLDVKNLVDIRDSRNFELVMRIESGLKNQNREFFTDLNGFQMQRRKTQKKLPLQANFYPAPTAVFIQDGKARLTLQTQQANGVASLEQGQIEIVMDRRLMQDDNRGLGQGVTDNKVTPSNFRLLLEGFSTPPSKGDKPSPVAYPSALSMALSNELTYPLYAFHAPATLPVDTFLPFFGGLSQPLPCDYHLVNLKSLQLGVSEAPSETLAMILHRIGYDCKFDFTCKEAEITFKDMFDSMSVGQVDEVSLSLMYTKASLQPSSPLRVDPMELQAYKLKFR